ncbi:Methyltransferase type 11 domain-containing protein [uncultured Gammaproteobacteria bacterium]
MTSSPVIPPPPPAPPPPTGSATFSSAISDAHNYISWIIDEFEPFLSSPILEIGVGHGSFFQRLRHHGHYIGVDLDAEAVAESRRRYPDADFRQADILSETFTADPVLAGAGAVVCANVLEHIEDDRTAVANLLTVLAPGGHLLLFVPALPALYSDLDRLAGHHRRYTKTRLQKILAGLPGEIVRLDYFNSIGGLGWWVNSLFTHTSLGSQGVNAQISLFDRYVLPVSRLINPLTRGWFGQSLVCVVRRTK